MTASATALDLRRAQLDDIRRRRAEGHQDPEDAAIEAAAIADLEAAEDRQPRRAITRRLADVRRQPLRWLWPARIPLGKLSMLVGDPGLGKSLLTLSIAATVSLGAAWPIGGEGAAPQGDVMLVSAEDDPGDTIRPRLEAAGADLTRVHILEAIAELTDDGERMRRPWNLGDLAELERELERIPRCVLVLIDPLSAYLAGTDSHVNADVRALLAPLADLAARRGVAIIAVSHLNKSHGPAIYRTTGSLAFTAAARAVLCATKDGNDDGRRLLAPVKANLAPDALGLAYRIGTDETGTPRVEWEPEPIAVDADAALAALMEDREERTERAEAGSWLRELLADGPRRVKDILREAKGTFAERTLQRARRDIGAELIREGFGGECRWGLPANLAHSPTPQNHGENANFGENEEEREFASSARGHTCHSRQESGYRGSGEYEESEL